MPETKKSLEFREKRIMEALRTVFHPETKKLLHKELQSIRDKIAQIECLEMDELDDVTPIDLDEY